VRTTNSPALFPRSRDENGTRAIDGRGAGERKIKKTRKNPFPRVYRLYKVFASPVLFCFVFRFFCALSYDYFFLKTRHHRFIRSCSSPGRGVPVVRNNIKIRSNPQITINATYRFRPRDAKYSLVRSRAPRRYSYIQYPVAGRHLVAISCTRRGFRRNRVSPSSRTRIWSKFFL